MTSLPAPPKFTSSRKSSSPPEPTTNQPETQAQIGTSTTPTDDGSHLGSFVMQEIEAGGGGGEDDPIGVGEDGNPLPERVEPEQISQEAFWIVFQTAFDMPAMVISQFEPMAAGVAIQQRERDIARACSDAIYALLEIYYPKALLPGSDTVAHVIAATPFLFAKVMIVREIFRARRARDVSPRETEKRKPEPKETAAPRRAQEATEAEWSDIPPADVIGGSWNLPDQQEAAH